MLSVVTPENLLTPSHKAGRVLPLRDFWQYPRPHNTTRLDASRPPAACLQEFADVELDGHDEGVQQPHVTAAVDLVQVVVLVRILQNAKTFASQELDTALHVISADIGMPDWSSQEQQGRCRTLK